MASSRRKTIAMFMVLISLLASTISGEDTLFSGESLNAGEFLEKNQYRFIMQGDCNLVLYVNKTKALWNSGTNGKGTACKATLQNNGNLVIFSGPDVVWTSGSARGPNNYRLVVQTDGNVVIYGSALWATNTVQSRKKLL